jgi:glycogen synthase
MKIEKMLVTGDALFLRRHRPLFEAFSLYGAQVDYLVGDEPFRLTLLNEAYKILNKVIYALSPLIAGQRQKNEQTFIAKSKQIEQRIRQLQPQPDFVLHVFGMYCPFWDDGAIPYGMYLDYTMSLAHRNWAAWAPFTSAQSFEAWKDCERSAYQRAYHLFAMSNVVKLSLIQDYGIKPEKISVVGSFAGRHKVYSGEKPFGRQQILFNAGDFNRKGGDLVLAAFEQVRQVMPEARLTIIGKKVGNHQAGVYNPGRIGSLAAMQALFLQTDVVVAPGRCDPFPTFVIEAMNYGVPCIVSGNDGMPEIVDHEMTGLVIEPTTPESLAREIVRLLGNTSTLTMMSQQARQKVREKFNQAKIAEVMINVLRDKDSSHTDY